MIDRMQIYVSYPALGRIGINDARELWDLISARILDTQTVDIRFDDYEWTPAKGWERVN